MTAILSASDAIINLFTSNLSPEVYFVMRKMLELLILNIVLLIFSMFIDIVPSLLIVVPFFSAFLPSMMK